MVEVSSRRCWGRPAAIEAGEAEIGDLSALAHSTANRVNALIGKAALADLQAIPRAGGALEQCRSRYVMRDDPQFRSAKARHAPGPVA